MARRVRSLISRGVAAFSALLTTDAGVHPTDEWGGMDWFIL